MNICKKQILNILDLKLALYKEVKPVKAEITKKWQEMIQENRKNSTSPEVDNSLPKKKRRVQKPKSPLRSTRKQKLESGSSKPNSDLRELVIAFEEEKTKAEREDNAKYRTKHLAGTAENKEQTPMRKRTFLAKDALQEYWDNLPATDHQSDAELTVILRDTLPGKRFNKAGYTFDAGGRLKDSFIHIKTARDKTGDFIIKTNEQKKVITTVPKYEASLIFSTYNISI